MELQERVIPLMTVTESAALKIKQLMSEEDDVNVLRVAIQGGGCLKIGRASCRERVFITV